MSSRYDDRDHDREGQNRGRRSESDYGRSWGGRSQGRYRYGDNEQENERYGRERGYGSESRGRGAESSGRSREYGGGSQYGGGGSQYGSGSQYGGGSRPHPSASRPSHTGQRAARRHHGRDLTLKSGSFRSSYQAARPLNDRLNGLPFSGGSNHAVPVPRLR